MWIRTLLFSAILASAAAAAPANAQLRERQVFEPNWISPTQHRHGQDRHQQQDIRPLREVVAELRARYGGEYIGHRLEDGARPIYVIRWRMPDGEVRDFRVNAAR